MTPKEYEHLLKSTDNREKKKYLLQNDTVYNSAFSKRA